MTKLMLENYFWNSYAKSYDNLARYYYPYKELVREVCDYIDMYANGRLLKILDAGCGTGNYAIELSRRGHLITGIDASPIMIAKSKDKNRCLPEEYQVELLEHDLNEHLPFENESFDVIISIHVLYTLSNLKGFLSEIHRVAKRNSLIVIVNSCAPMSLSAAVKPQWRMSRGFERYRALISLVSVGLFNFIIALREKNGTYNLTTADNLDELLSVIGAKHIRISYPYVGSALAIGHLE